MAESVAPAPAPANPTTNTTAQAPAAPATVGTYVGYGVAAGVAVLFVYAFLRKRAQRRGELMESALEKRLEARVRPDAEAPPPPGEQPEPAPLPRRERPPEKQETEAQLAARRAEEAAEAARIEAKRAIEAAREKDDAEAARKAEEAREAAQKAREEAEALKRQAEEDEVRRKAEEEERKKAEYKAKKAQEAEDKERRKREAEERVRQEEEAARQKLAAEAEAKRLAEEAERKKVEAQSGKTLAEGLAKTRGGFMASLNSLFGRTKVLDEAVLGELEEVLFSADIGVKTATSLLEFARDKVRSKDLSDAEKLKGAMRQEVRRIVDLPGRIDFSSKKPFVVMIAGVNGSGKTTTVGKLAAKLTAEGRKVLLVAADTFRAAATEQLEVWGQRANAPVVKAKEGSDPGALVFDGLKRAESEGFDVVLVDTAGRLHTKAPLMEELKRVKRVMAKALPGSPHEVLLVLDSTNGQNAIAQAREFNAALEVQGLVLTKLDGTAKGGVIIGICDELKVPVRYVGIGEAVGDLKPFEPAEFVQALFE